MTAINVFILLVLQDVTLCVNELGSRKDIMKLLLLYKRNMKHNKENLFILIMRTIDI